MLIETSPAVALPPNKKPRSLLQRLLPQTLWMRVALLVGTMICLPVLIMSYIVEVQGRAALLHEKGEKLYGITRLLNDAMGDALALTEEQKATLSRDQQIAILHQRLTPAAEEVVKAYPGVGAGYYDRRLDAIMTYAPNAEFNYVVGMRIPPDHLGNEVMLKGVPMTAFGSQVRGDIMNAMWPIQRNGEVIGYTWANELNDSVQKQILRLDLSVLAVLIGGLSVSLALVLLLSRSFGRDVDIVKDGLHRLQFDLGAPLPPLKGEIGEIAKSVNVMATALQEAKGLNENILNSIDDGVVTVDNQGCITLLNPAAQKIIGCDPGDVLNRDYMGLFHEQAAFQSMLLDTLHSGKSYSDVERDYPLRDKTLYVSLSTRLIRNSKGEKIGAAAFIRDLTSQRALQRHAERAEQLAVVGELAAGVAHEVRNPLTAIRGFVQYLREGANPDELEEYTGIILTEVDSINRVIQQLLNFARPAPQNYQKVALAQLVNDALVLVKTRSVSGRIEFALDVAADIAEIEVDAEQIKQVLLNLLLNAVQAIEGQGEVVVSAHNGTQGTVELRIKDNGAGITHQDKARIFSPFFTTKPSGTGLGLPIVQRIIAEHGGEIMLESAKGSGTTVILSLPAHRERRETP